MVDVDEASLTTLGGALPPEGTLFGSTAWKSIFPRDYYKLYKNFVYTSQGGKTKAGISLLFSKDKTEVQANVPFRTTKRKGNHYWHTILVKLTPVLVEGFPLSTTSGSSNANADRYVMREVYIPSASEGSLFIKDEFTSPRPFNIGLSPVPIAAAVTYDLINRRGGFPECLHEKLTIPSVSTTGSRRLPEQVFPETNFTTWSPYILSDEQDLKDGVYYRVRVTVYPPAMPDPLTRKS